MVQAPQRTAFSGPTLVRLLARLADVDVRESRQSLSDQLSQWLGWTDAIALSTALSGNPSDVASSPRAFGDDAEKLCAHVRTSLTKAIANACGLAATKRNRPAQASAQGAPLDAATDYADFRQRYLSMQQAMETDLGDLRSRLRVMLSRRTPGMARLAAVDGVMERALEARERSLLTSVPALLGMYFERLRGAEPQAPADASTSGNAAASTPGAWLDVFRNDMQSVLLAELEVRFQPVDGLLAALRTS